MWNSDNIKNSDKTEAVRLVLIEDDLNFADNVKLFLSDKKEYELIAHFTGCESALSGNSLTEADVLLLDIKLPGISGLQAIPKILKINNNLHIIILSSFNHDAKLFRALQLGAKGYLLKTDYFVHFESAVQQVIFGGTLFSPEMAKKVLKFFRIRPLAKVKLTKREKEILKLLKTGQTKKEMATALKVSYGTVDTHVKHIYKKLQVNSNVQAVLRAGEMGM